MLSFWIHVSVSFGWIRRSEISGLFGNSIFRFSRNFHTVFCSLQFYQQCMKVPFSLHSHQNLSFLVFLIQPFWEVRDGIVVVLICVSLIVMLRIFSCACWPPLYLLGRTSVQVLCPFLSQVVFFYVVWILCIFWVLTLIWCVCKYSIFF